MRPDVGRGRLAESRDGALGRARFLLSPSLDAMLAQPIVGSREVQGGGS